MPPSVLSQKFADKIEPRYYRDLFVVLFESMIHDSEKHINMLEFLRERLEEA